MPSGVSPFGEPSARGGSCSQAAGLPKSCEDLLRGGDHQHAAVLRIGDRDRPVLQQVGVVGLVQVARVRSRYARVAVGPEQLPGGEGELDDALVLLLVGDDAGAAVDEEGVVGKVEAAGRRRVGARGELPEHLLLGVDDDQAVVAAVGDHQAAA